MNCFAEMTKRFARVYSTISNLLSDWKKTFKIVIGFSIANFVIFFGFHWALGGLFVYPMAFKNQLNWLSLIYTVLLALLYLFANTILASWAISIWSDKPSFKLALRGIFDACIRIIIFGVPLFVLIFIAWITSAFGTGENTGIFIFPSWLNFAKSPPDFRISMVMSFAVPVILLLLIRIPTLLSRITEGENASTALLKALSDANGRYFLFLSCFIPLGLAFWFVNANLMNVMYINIFVFSILMVASTAIGHALYIESTGA